MIDRIHKLNKGNNLIDIICKWNKGNKLIDECKERRDARYERGDNEEQRARPV